MWAIRTPASLRARRCQLIFGGADWTGDVGVLLHNSVLWLAGGGTVNVPWLSESPITGTLMADDPDYPVLVTFDSTGMAFGVYTATIIVQTDDMFAGPIAIPVEMDVGARIYLPLAMHNYTGAPDLVVEQIVTTPNDVQVVILIQGNAPVSGDGFWVDFYIAPDPVPTAVNQIWPNLADHGMVWGVETTLGVGELLTLTVGGPFYWASSSDVIWPLALGTPVYAQVDSANTGTDYGAVLEMDEILGEPYDNILGATVATGSGAVQHKATGSFQSVDLHGLPPRW